MQKRVFIKNAAILTVTALLLRTAGIFFRVFLSGRIGAEGMGLYQIIFSVYILAITFASAGISVGVTRLITDYASHQSKKGVINIVSVAFAASVLLGVLSGLALYFSADLLCVHWLGDIRAAASIRILAPSLPFIAVSSCLRGYFVARRKVAVSSSAQIFEEICRMVIIFVLIERIGNGSLERACMAIVIGNTVAEVLSCIFMYIGYLFDRRSITGYDSQKPPGRLSIVGKLFAIATPLAASSYLNTTLHTAENLLVPNALTKFTLSREMSLSQFGMLKAMAMPVLFFPSSFLGALATLLIPEVSEANALGYKENLRRTIGAVLHVSIVSSVLIAGVFLLFSGQLGVLIYGSAEVGRYIWMLAPILPFMYIESIALGILHGLNQQVHTLKLSVVDSLLRIALIMLVVPHYGIDAFIWIMIFSNIFTPIFNMRRLLNVSNTAMMWGKWILKPLVAMIISIAATYYWVCLPLVGKAGSIVLVTVGVLCICAVYLAVLIVIHGITTEDLRPLRKRR